MQNKIKIVYLIGQLGLGGSETQIYRLLSHIDLKRFACTVIVFNTSPNVVLNQAIENLDIPVIAIPEHCRTVFQRVCFLFRVFYEIRPHIVHSWTVHDNVYAGLVGFLAGIPVRWGSLRGSTRLRGFSSLPGLYKWLSLHSVSHLVVNAQPLIEELLLEGIRPERILLLPNCIEFDLACSEFSLLDFGLSPENCLIGTVGNLRQVKNHQMFIKMIAQLVPEFPELRGMIIGQPIPDEPDLPGQLKQLITDLDLKERVILAGFRDNVLAIMRHFSVFCLTSTSEGSPNVILEAMSLKRPVVSTGVGGIPALIQDGINGYLVLPGDVDGMAAAVRRLLKDSVLQAEIGQAGYNLGQKYDCKCVVQTLCNLYEKAISRTK